MKPLILVVDDEEYFLAAVKRNFHFSGIKGVHTEKDPCKVENLIRESEEFFDIAVIDVNMPGMNGVEVLDLIKQHSPETECIMVSAMEDVKTAVKCLRKGAYDYLVKPFVGNDLVNACKNALERKKLLEIVDLAKNRKAPELTNRQAFQHITTVSDKMMRTLKEAELHAASDVPILITGESGVGKELLAKAVHAASARAEFPFTPVNMASVNENLFESEFFGHARGAFTGAENERAGYLEKTEGGTLFLDEIGTLSPGLQAKLLRILQEGDYFKVGTDRNRKINIRFVAATNENLEEQIAAGRFRKDLYYRLRGAWVHLPPLKERKEDIRGLIGAFLKEFGYEYGKPKIYEDVFSILLNYDYPGNVRELKSIVQSSLNLCENGVLSVRSLPPFLKRNRKTNAPKHGELEESEILPLSEIEKEHILKAYKATGENKLRTARLLGISPNTLRNRLKSYGGSQ